MKVLAWGTYDLSKPRVRILMRALQDSDLEVRECHIDVWQAVADKSQVSAWTDRLRFVLRWILAYPKLIWCLLRGPRSDVIFVGYLGQIDVLVLWPLARILGIRVVWDAFISLYNTVVEDRSMVGRKHPLAWFLYAVEWLAVRAVDKVVLDTQAHADYFVGKFGLPKDRTGVVFVGVEQEVFELAEVEREPDEPFTVLFYGQFIPLHGIPTIIEAARILQDEDVRWVLIGKGQEAPKVEAMLEEHPLPKLEWIPWVEYQELATWMARADVCLGIFDDGGKASRVIPNKVFQILALGKPLITRDSPAIRELITGAEDGVALVTPKDAAALAGAVARFRLSEFDNSGLYMGLRQRIFAGSISDQLLDLLDEPKPGGD